MNQAFECVFADLVPVHSEEKVEPTRVVWVSASGFYTSRVFPTKQRAWDFALTRKGEVIVQAADEPPPSQRRATNRPFVKLCAHGAMKWHKQRRFKSKST